MMISLFSIGIMPIYHMLANPFFHHHLLSIVPTFCFHMLSLNTYIDLVCSSYLLPSYAYIMLVDGLPIPIFPSPEYTSATMCTK